MAIYQFHIRDQHGLILDEDGIELPNTLAAVREALRSASEFFADASAPTDMMFEITDEVGRLVLALPIRNFAAPADEDYIALAS
jgi:hypothetical protein